MSETKARLVDTTTRSRRWNPIREIFSRASINDSEARQRRRAPRELTAFVLAGGGSRGAVQVGMLSELVARGIRADRVYGASVGAVNAAAYCGDPTPEGIENLENVWRNLRGDEVFPKSRLAGPWIFFQQRESVHANSGLRKLIEDGLKFENMEDSPIPFEVVATSLTDGKERSIAHGPALEALLASTAIPAILPPVRIGDELLIDGGVVNNVPISHALDVGATRIYVLLCGPLNYQPPTAKRPIEAIMTAFFVAVHARFVRELAAVPPNVAVTVFSGGGEPSGTYRDFSSTPELIVQGRAEAARVLDAAGASIGTRSPDAGSPDAGSSDSGSLGVESRSATGEFGMATP